MMTKIIKCSDKISITPQQKKLIREVSNELRKIKKSFPSIDEIIIRGGFVPDILLGKEPKDIDIFYCIKDKNGNYSIKCHCDEIRKQIDRLNLKFIGKKYKYDLENSFEKEPRLKPIQRTASFFSYHSDWLSMFCLDTNGDIWTNKTTFTYFKKRIHEVRYEGFLPWAYYPKPTDSNNYYASLAYEAIRGLDHIQRRKLKMGSQFSELLENTPFILKRVSEVKEGEGVIRYLNHKFGNLDTFMKVIEQMNLKNKSDITRELKMIFRKYEKN